MLKQVTDALIMYIRGVISSVYLYVPIIIIKKILSLHIVYIALVLGSTTILALICRAMRELNFELFKKEHRILCTMV